MVIAGGVGRVGVAGGAGSPPSVYRQSASLASPSVASLVFVCLQRFPLVLLGPQQHLVLLRGPHLVRGRGGGVCCWWLLSPLSCTQLARADSVVSAMFYSHSDSVFVCGPRTNSADRRPAPALTSALSCAQSWQAPNTSQPTTYRTAPHPGPEEYKQKPPKNPKS